jgi:hypothetical protein
VTNSTNVTDLPITLAMPNVWPRCRRGTAIRSIVCSGQASIETATLVSKDGAVATCGIDVLWG